MNRARKVEKMENMLMKIYKLLESLPSGSGQAIEHDIKQGHQSTL